MRTQAMLCNKMSTEEMLSSDDEKEEDSNVRSYPRGHRRVDDMAEDLDLLLQELVRVDKLAWRGHAGSRHH
jgi:hypothetical protein